MLNKRQIAIILFSLFVIIISTSVSVSAWEDCPFGIEDEAYPGTCWRYVDTNGDGICDYSQYEPSEGFQEDNTETQSSTQIQQNQTKFPIMLIISLIISIFIIAILKILVKTKKLLNSKEKIILNILLFIFFVPSAISGIILLLMTNMGILSQFGQAFNLWHNITSLFFMWISAYHIIWHTKYYVNGIRKLFKAK